MNRVPIKFVPLPWIVLPPETTNRLRPEKDWIWIIFAQDSLRRLTIYDIYQDGFHRLDSAASMTEFVFLTHG
jgi:hypothetical protein